MKQVAGGAAVLLVAEARCITRSTIGGQTR